MYRILYSLLLALTFATSTLPLTVNSTLLENKKTGKRVLLFGEMHTQYIDQMLNEEKQATCNAIEQRQKQDFTTLAHKLLDLNPEKGAQTVVITETSANSLGGLFEQESDLVEKQDNQDETIQVMPRIFMRTILAPATTADEKLALFQESIKPFNDIPAASFVFDNGMRWIAGDTTRTQKDKFLVFTIYDHWQSILDSIKINEDMPPDLAELSITNVKEDISFWHDEFVKHGLDDPYAQEILRSINTGVQAGNLSESDHIAALHAYLHNNDKQAERAALNNNILKLVSLKNDLELKRYLTVFEQDNQLKHIIMNFGDIHMQLIKKRLLDTGYVMVAQSGHTVCSEIASKDEAKKEIAQSLEVLKKHQNLVQVDTLFKDEDLS